MCSSIVFRLHQHGKVTQYYNIKFERNNKIYHTEKMITNRISLIICLLEKYIVTPILLNIFDGC